MSGPPPNVNNFKNIFGKKDYLADFKKKKEAAMSS